MTVAKRAETRSPKHGTQQSARLSPSNDKKNNRSKMAKFTFEIDVYSDPVCPWCYLGNEALDRAIATYTAQHPDVDFRLTWKPYLLWPNAGVSGTYI